MDPDKKEIEKTGEVGFTVILQIGKSSTFRWFHIHIIEILR